MARTLCEVCQYPSAVCVCHGVEKIHNKTHIVILQHPSERKAAKNTARLVQLCCANVTVSVGESSIDFNSIADLIKRQSIHVSDSKESGVSLPARKQRVWSVIYPHAHSQFVEHYRDECHDDQSKHGIILLDGTWRKAYKIWQLNTWLHALPSLCFQSPPASRYVIRSGAPHGGLSTLEAVAYSLKHLESCRTTPLLQAMDVMMENYLRFSLR